MAITLETIQQLCMEGESNRLDYKRDQYPFVGVSDPEKTELLKDILAMANAFRSQIAYILIGIEQQLDGTGKAIGISKDQFIDDASLQQFVNGKTNRPIEFQSYSVQIDEAKIVQVIEIPIQKERPYYSRKQFGSIKPAEVELRISSTTRPAIPDEIARMGKEEQAIQNQRQINISFHVPGNTSDDIEFKAFDISLKGEPPFENNLKIIDVLNISRPIQFKSKFTYIRDIFRTLRIDVGLENKSCLSAEQLEIISIVKNCSNECVRKKEYFPQRPTGNPAFDSCEFLAHTPLQLQKLHPGQYDSAFESLYFDVMNNGNFILDITVLGKDMQPINKQVNINIQQIPYPIDAEEVDTFFEYFVDEEKYWDFLDSTHKE